MSASPEETLAGAAAQPAAAASATSFPAAAEPRFLNRELQWLAFNERVLGLAEDERTPLLERVRFVAIYSRNLDEFFMKRVGGLRRQIEMGVVAPGFDGRTPAETLAAIRARVLPLAERKSDLYRKLVPLLERVGIQFVRHADLDERERRQIQAWYRANVFPILTPLAVDRGHRFPFISNLSVSLGVMLRRPGERDPVFARVKIPEIVEHWHRISRDAMRFVSVVDVVEHNIRDLFPGMEILRVLPFRVTRNADVERDHEDADDLLDQMQLQLRERRFAPVVRMQIRTGGSKRLLRFLCEEMEIEPSDVYETTGLINYAALEEIADLPLAEHRYSPWSPVTPPSLQDRESGIFRAIKRGDVLLHHPYESFDDSVERFIEEAASDPNVVAIKQVLYRTSGDSPFIPELIRAAELGKQVAVLVEVRARFDEARNIHWARKLEEAGVHVAYGVVGLKTHTKMTLVVRREADGLRPYVHIGSGNYHSRTALLYEDVGLLTCKPDIAEDAINLFNYMTGRSRQHEYRKLLVAPHSMKQRFIAMVSREIERHRPDSPGRVVAKMNQLQDTDVMDLLYRASQAGVQIDLIVRGFCTLRPGVPGLSENVRVISILGRFLEHSRIFWFRNGSVDPLDGEFYISSADWMYRNLETRVEAACPVEDRALRRRLWSVLEACLADRRQAWDLRGDGSYKLRTPDGLEPNDPRALGVHQVLMNAALDSVRRVEETE
jgi:polyphosphate kinase